MSADNFLGTKTPIEKFNEWWDEAQKTSLQYANAMVLSTVDSSGQPSSRVVLLKETRPQGLVFYTNYHSQKGEQLALNPKVAANFYWDPLFRQVKWQGQIEKVPRSESQAYWQQRPRMSQISQTVSRQSQPVESRELMDQEYAQAEAQWQNQEIPCPPHWGGYLIVPTYVEFWIGRDGRFHDRYTYRKVENHWQAQRLYP